MNQSFFIAAVGAHQQLKRLTVHGNNIANLNTYGFKAEKSRFASLMYEDLKGIGGAAGGEGDFEMLPSGVAGRFGPRTRISSPGPWPRPGGIRTTPSPETASSPWRTWRPATSPSPGTARLSSPS